MQNLTDTVGSLPILNLKGTTRSDSNRNFPMEPEGSSKAPPPFFQNEENGNQCSPPPPPPPPENQRQQSPA